MTDTLRGLRVLIAEDNFLIGETLREILLGFGCAVVGPIADLQGVMSEIESAEIDAALLDVQLGDANILPAAFALADRGVPFIVTTGGGKSMNLPSVLAQAPHLNKPFSAQQLEMTMTATFPRGAETQISSK